jgi:hypothetical protein
MPAIATQKPPASESQPDPGHITTTVPPPIGSNAERIATARAVGWPGEAFHLTAGYIERRLSSAFLWES